METKKIPCKTFYLMTDNNFENWLYESFTRNKPIRRRNCFIYKFKNFREIILTQEELIDFKNSFIHDSKFDYKIYNLTKYFLNRYCYTYPSLANDQTVQRTYVPGNHFFLAKRADYFGKTEIISTLKSPFYYLDLEDAIEIPFSEKELKQLKDEQDQKADIKLIDEMLLPSLNEILEKYGLHKEKGRAIKFKNYTDFTKLFKKLLEESLIKELKESGFEAKLYKTKSLKWTDIIIDQNDIKLKSKDDNNLT